MADRQHVDFLLGTLGDPEGRKRWLQYKMANPGMDLAGVNLANKDLRDYDLSDADLSAASLFNCNLSGADFSDSNLAQADLRRSTMTNCCLDRSNLSGASMQGVTLTDAAIEDANLSEARLQGADLIGADLGSSNLKAADLRSACLKYARLSGANLVGANVAEADLTGSVMDDFAPNMMRNFDLAIIDDRKFRMMKSRTKPKGRPSDSTRNLGDTAQITGDTAQELAEAGVSGDTARELFGKAEGTGSRPPFEAKAKSAETAPPPRAEAPPPRAEAAPTPPPPPRPEPKPAEPKSPRQEAKMGDSAPQYQPFVREEEPPKAEAPPRPKPRAEEKPKEEKTGSFFRRLMGDGAEKDKKQQGPPGNPFVGAYIGRKIDLETDEGCFRILGVKDGSSKDDVSKAFRAKAKLFHPDKAAHLEPKLQALAREQFELARKAHDTLKRRGGNTMSDIKWPDGVPRRQSPYDHTLDELAKIVRLNPSHEAMVYNYAFKCYEAGKLDEGIKQFERVLVLNPHNVDAQHNLKALKLQKAFKI